MSDSLVGDRNESIFNLKFPTDPDTGLPDNYYEANTYECEAITFTSIFSIIGAAIGYGIAYLIYRFGDKDKYDSRILIAKDN